MINKRKHRRVPMAAVATVQYSDAGIMHSAEAAISSISLGGIGIYTDRVIEDICDVSIAIPFISIEGAMETIAVEGQVVYSRKMGSVIFIGIQFDNEISIENHPSLNKYIERALRWNS